MILNFKKQINGQPTHFTQRIWESLLRDGVECDREEMGAKLKEFPDIGSYEIGTYNPKRHTIREDSKKRWKPGMLIHAHQWEGRPRRSKNERFAPIFKCTCVQEIEIIVKSEYLTDDVVKVDGKVLTTEEMQRLAWNDGFENLVAFQMYFKQSFKGRIIHWTDLKY